MNFPGSDEYIDIHSHGVSSTGGIFTVGNLMAHENLSPDTAHGNVLSAGIHPWYLNEENQYIQLDYIRKISAHERIIALGEAGFDKIRGPSFTLQRSVFSEQAVIADKARKPLFIHCVRSWDELLNAHKALRPSVPWIIHGFRGRKELASQLLSRGMYISFWYDFIIRPESSDLVRFLPSNRIFFETDGADINIGDIYKKAASDLSMDLVDLKMIICNNYYNLFGKND